VAQLGARLDGIEEVVGSNPIGSTTFQRYLHVCGAGLFNCICGARSAINSRLQFRKFW
jgi:hypothetical protein